MCKMTEALKAYIGNKTYVTSCELRAFEAGYLAGAQSGLDPAQGDDISEISTLCILQPSHKNDEKLSDLTPEEKTTIQALAFQAFAAALRHVAEDERMLSEKDGQQ